MKHYHLLIVLIILGIFSSCEQTLDPSSVSNIIKKDLANVIIKQESPSEINLFVDLSSSMKNHLSNKIENRNNSYEEFIKQIYSSKHEADFNLYGFGEDIRFVGKNEEVVKSLLKSDTYDESYSRINLAFNKIVNDTSGALNIVLSDARYEDTEGGMSKFSFIVGNSFKEYVNKNKLFGVIANKIWYYYEQAKVNGLTPLYLFIFGNYKHYNFIVDNLLNLGDDSFILSPYPDNKVKVQFTNTNNIPGDQHFTIAEVDDYSTPVSFKISFIRNTTNDYYKKMLANENYSLYIYENSLLVDGDDYKVSNNWTKLPSNDFKVIINNKFNKDSTNYTIELSCETLIKETGNFQIYKFELISNIPKWISDKYNSEDINNVEKTYKFSDFFMSLQNHLISNPVPSQIYYLIIK